MISLEAVQGKTITSQLDASGNSSLGISNGTAVSAPPVLSHQFVVQKQANWSLTVGAEVEEGAGLAVTASFPNGTVEAFSQNLFTNGTSLFALYVGPDAPAGQYTITVNVAPSTVLLGSSWVENRNFNVPTTFPSLEFPNNPDPTRFLFAYSVITLGSGLIAYSLLAEFVHLQKSARNPRGETS
ncbi:MAG: hypothetical protein ACLQEQ_09775 [Nitrososphaerales archaeon]